MFNMSTAMFVEDSLHYVKHFVNSNNKNQGLHFYSRDINM